MKTTKTTENLCPNKGKRVKVSGTSSPFATHWKYMKGSTESSSSPTALKSEILAEMGIGMLDSEESSSSVASAIALAVSGSADENSNEATPHTDAPKYYHKPAEYLRSIDNTLDTSGDSENVLTKPRDFVKEASLDNSNITGSSGKCGPVGSPHPSQTASPASLGAHVPWTNKVTRSPLARIDTTQGNSYFRNATVQPTTSAYSITTAVTSTKAADSEFVELPSPSSVPSTSKQAAVANLKQKHMGQGKQLKRQPDEARDDFFLYRHPSTKSDGSGTNFFNILSDEIVLHIFKWLPKKALLRCSTVCQRFNRCVNDESLWTRLDLGGRSLRAGSVQQILSRGVVILRLAQAEIKPPIFDTSLQQFDSKLQYLDLSMVSISKSSLKTFLACCRHLKKLSLENVAVNDEICNEIAANSNLEALNLAMCVGIEAWSIRKIMESLKNLNSLNISWTNLSIDGITAIVTKVTPQLMRLNIAGCRKTMFDSHLASLAKRCPLLLELDLSDCTGLTGKSISIICKFKMLEYLSLSRCYLIPVSSYLELSNLQTLAYLDVFGMLSDSAMEMLQQNLCRLGINKFIHSSVARPTVGTRRTSIWGLRTRD